MTRADGLMAFFADIDAENVEDYRRWHNCEHMEERVSIPGFLRGLRYRGYEGAPSFLMSYETEDAAVLGSQPYHDALNAPTPWTKEALKWFRHPARAIYGLLSQAGEAHWRAAPWAMTARFNVVEAAESDFVETAGPAIARRAVADAAVARARLYVVDERISGMMTSERRIYGGGPGDQKYLMMFELVAPFDAVGEGALADRDAFGEAGCVDLFLDRFSIDFEMEAPAR